VSPPHWGRRLCSLPRKKFDFGSQIGKFWCKLGAFLYSSPQAGLNAISTVKITLRTPFPGVPAGKDPWRQQCIFIAKLVSIAVMTYSYVYHLRNLRPVNLLRTQRINFSMRPQHVGMARDPTVVLCLLSRESLRIPA